MVVYISTMQECSLSAAESEEEYLSLSGSNFYSPNSEDESDSSDYNVRVKKAKTSVKNKKVFASKKKKITNQVPKCGSKQQHKVLRNKKVNDHGNEGGEISCNVACSDVEEVVGDIPKKRKKGENSRIFRKKRKIAGEPYKSTKGYIVPGKCLPLNPCTKCKLRCKDIADEERQRIFSYYNTNLTSQQQNDWICSHVSKVAVSRRRKDTKNPEKRLNTYRYHFDIEGKPVPVCRQFFLATLALKKKKVHYTIEHATSINTAKVDERGKSESHNKTPDALVKSAEEFISNLPVVPSHYCRKDSNRRYLPSHLNMNIIYNDYKKGMDETGESAVSFNVFRNSFKLFNLAFHKPKKDKCGLCESIKNKTASEDMTATDRESYLTHMNEKHATYAEYKEDTKETKENASLIVASFDLQRVLTTPHSDSTLMYYARKYAFYNLTVYENRNGRGTCYVWGECDGRKGSTEISTCVSLWLQDIDKELGEHQQLDIVLYCDNCPGQNKNRCMFSMLYHNCQKLPGVRSIQLKFLLTGHTYMGADTVHSTIATFIKKRTIMAPSQWPFVIEMARTNPSPLLVRKLEYSDFEDWESLQDNYFPKTLKDCEGNRIRWSALRQMVSTTGN
ncbi:uncharacterized protein LOC134536622 [Bacillus rossius redtenbacheri]|uniref:uncharacterized protein LOC134536622 n=1 Tax=Bacillus rossius redtenbacheri TaxID=93214 RepID=UPI002FDE30E6